MKRIIAVAVLAAIATGCSSIQESAQTRVDQNGTNRITTVKINTLFDAKAVVDKINASNGSVRCSVTHPEPGSFWLRYKFRVMGCKIGRAHV